ncbi:MAG: amino acid ABC transporter permease [Synergistaceae bacterium]|jgi:His/Glu/Gln/Arg/opine family amino acid ABC transporter permease subunit|nr:amino acid ABC transporter permease [Synergistaceae bacterium]
MELAFFGEIFTKYWPMFEEGTKNALFFTLFSTLAGFVWGTILALIKVSRIRPLEWASRFYTSIFRGTPLLVQLYMVYFATPQLTGYAISALESAVLAFGLNSAAYISEILRGGMEAVDKGQKDAATALGVPYAKTMFHIVIPQALKHVLPGLVNEMIALLKESSLISVIAVTDITRAAQRVINLTFRPFEPFLVAATIYYVLVMILSIVANRLEVWVRRSD